jgi:GNAT superfamily N-acetyltransferase
LTHEVEPDEILLIAEYDGISAGYAMADSCTDDPEYQGELSGLYVHPAHQGQGVGRVLLTEIAVRLAAQGIYSLRVGVLRVNPSRAFYERMGGQYLYDRDHNWDGVIVPECFYGWKDTRELQQKT